MSLAIIDYGRGNLFSLGMALQHIGAKFTFVSEPAEVRTASHIILPGVGAFGDCMCGLRDRGLVEPLIAAVRERATPLLGICVGMQVLADVGEEFGEHEGLGLIEGSVRRLSDPLEPRGSLRVPNVGWRKLQANRHSEVFSNLPADQTAYFIHSFAMQPTDPGDIAATIDFNGEAVTAAVSRDRVIGVQFHPEKSGIVGIELLRRFVSWAGA